MRSFKSETQNKTQNEEYTQGTATAEDLMKKMASAYDGRSSADIWRNILSEAEKSKRAGTLSNQEIDAFYQSFAPMLDSSQRKKLQSVVEKLKKIE